MKQLLEAIGGYRTPMKTMEFAGRTCYSSHPKIEEGTAVTFVTGIIKSGHESVIEHSRLVCRLKPRPAALRAYVAEVIATTGVCLSMSVIEECGVEQVILSGNYRAWRDMVHELYGKAGAYFGQGTASVLARSIEQVLSDVDPALAEGLKCLR